MEYGGITMRYVAMVSMFVILLAHTVSAAQQNWQSICPRDDVPYCKDVGKTAHNNSTNPPLLRGVKLGKIVGVSWRPKGSVIGVSEAIPSAGIPGSGKRMDLHP